MVGHIIAVLRRSPLVKDLEVIEMIEEESVQFLRARVEIVDGSLWQARTGEMLLRWDNAPHHPEIPTHPDHRQEGEEVVPSA
jgi:hypothetical protein